ncbi:MAG TPA: hypothetical protein VN493_09090 [Thermoanaerobaculia bacterium]|nr:hypothetical protein [Thermoanaerobaculia bacterium]
MSGKAFGFFTLVEKILTALLGQLPSYEKAPKQWVARELVRLFDVISKAHEGFAELSRWIHKCETAQTKEGKAYFLFEAGKVLNRLGDTCAKFLPWERNPSQVFDALKLLAPEIKDTLDYIESDEVSFREVVIENRLDPSRRAFQAVPQPDPARLPSSEMLQELQDRLQSLSAQCAEALEKLRRFATAELKVGDFF